VDEMLANRYLRTHRYGDALPFLEEVVRVHPDRVPARQKLILCYLLTGHVPESMSQLAELLEHHPAELPVAPDALDAIPAREVQEGLRRRRRVLPEGTFHARRARRGGAGHGRARRPRPATARGAGSGWIHGGVMRLPFRGRVVPLALAILAGMLSLVGCADDGEDPIAPPELRVGCVACHTDEARLQATADPSTTPGDTDSGEG